MFILFWYTGAENINVSIQFVRFFEDGNVKLVHIISVKIDKNIFDSIIDPESLFQAWQKFRNGKSKRKDVTQFEWNLESNIFKLHRDLVNGIYRHGSYTDFYITDPKLRHIHKATVRDRIVHHAVYQVVNTIFERSFIFDSYSCRIGKGTHAAVNRLEKFVRKVSKNYTGPCWALQFDVKKFFDSVDHDILLSILKQKISCPKTNRLLAEIVGSYSSSNSVGGGDATWNHSRERSPDWEFNLAVVRERVYGCI